MTAPLPARNLETPGGRVLVFANKADASVAAARQIASTIDAARTLRGKACIGLSTGATPTGVYRHLVELHRSDGLSFRDVSTFNLDEYYGVSPAEEHSYRYYMHQHLFAHVDLSPNRSHVLDGTTPEFAVDAHCAEYERWIELDGGLDLQLLGIGRNGHIGFNEPQSLDLAKALALRTHLIYLHPTTIEDGARDFGGDASLVPRQALTMGVATILAARSILILAFGAAKRPATMRALFEAPTMEIPASLIQTVRDRVVWIVDAEAID